MKDYKTKPTQKQKRYLQNKIDNGGNKYKAAKDSGYSESLAKNPEKIEQSKGLKQLLEFYFPEEYLFSNHIKNITQDVDKGAKNKSLDMAYKLKSLYPTEAQELEVGDLIIKISKKTD